jgi:hypothetical protein
VEGGVVFFQVGVGCEGGRLGEGIVEVMRLGVMLILVSVVGGVRRGSKGVVLGVGSAGLVGGGWSIVVWVVFVFHFGILLFFFA